MARPKKLTITRFANDTLTRRMLLLLLVCLSSCKNKETAPLAERTVPPQAEPAPQMSKFSVALFEKENLTQCFSSEVSISSVPVNRDAQEQQLLLGKIALLLIDDVVASSYGQDSSLQDADSASFTAMMGGIADGRWRNWPQSKRTVIETMLKSLIWPTEGLEKLVKTGTVSKVDACSFPNRVVLGTCLREGTAALQPSGSLSWKLSRYYFDVSSTSESDSGMKACIKIGGNWSAPGPDDRRAAGERLRQRALQLKEIQRRLP